MPMPISAKWTKKTPKWALKAKPIFRKILRSKNIFERENFGNDKFGEDFWGNE
jgi:hypothetical protein